jgi:MinD-like ATPase involved in chromosome partitioning or flagellar assembly
LLTVALLTQNPIAADAIEQLLHESTAFDMVYRASPIPSANDVLRALRSLDPEILLLDIGEWDLVSALVVQINQLKKRAVIIGFRGAWDRAQKMTFEDAGITDLLNDPFSLAALEEVAYDGLHRLRPITNNNILAFLPAKAGGGCSTVALNTAGALVSHFGRKVLLVECDRRSGVFSIMLNLQTRLGLSDALQNVGKMTQLDWQQYHEIAFGIHMLLAKLSRRGPPTSWAQFYQLLHFVQPQYEFVVADLPEVINGGTAEVVKCARGVFIVCTPEIPSLKLAAQRYVELEECEIPADKIHIVLNRWERGQLTLTEIEKSLGRPVFATLPNDYKRARKAMLESRLIDTDSAFGKDCKALAEKLGGLPDAGPRESKFSLIRKLVGMTE